MNSLFRHWFRRTSASCRRATRVSPRRGHLSLEQLEHRLVPATFTVNSLADILNPGPGVVTLRSAIQMANQTPGSDIINLTVAGLYDYPAITYRPRHGAAPSDARASGLLLRALGPRL